MQRNLIALRAAANGNQTGDPARIAATATREAVDVPTREAVDVSEDTGEDSAVDVPVDGDADRLINRAATADDGIK